MGLPARAGEISMSHDANSPYTPTHEYTTTVSGQPHLLTKPVLLFSGDEGTDFDISPPESHDFPAGEFTSPDFWKTVHSNWFQQKSLPWMWRYELRREAQQILPFLYLGSFTCLKDSSFMRREGISLLLAVRSKQSAMQRLISGEKVAEELGIAAASIEIADYRELITAFSHAIRCINDHISTGITSTTTAVQRKVFVFCESGNDRSASIVVAYLMVMLNLDAPSAISKVQYRRFSVNFDVEMKNTLVSFDSILGAKRDVVRAQRDLAICNAQVQGSRKRSFDNRDEAGASIAGTSGMDDTDDSDEYSLHHRNQSAPFQDRGDCF
jgi:dual specificity protein phosphatase-like protein